MDSVITVYQNSVTIFILKSLFLSVGRKEENILFKDVGHMVKDHSDSKRGNPLSPHGLLFLISSKGSFICTIPQIG